MMAMPSTDPPPRQFSLKLPLPGGSRPRSGSVQSTATRASLASNATRASFASVTSTMGRVLQSSARKLGDTRAGKSARRLLGMPREHFETIEEDEYIELGADEEATPASEETQWTRSVRSALVWGEYAQEVFGAAAFAADICLDVILIMEYFRTNNPVCGSLATSFVVLQFACTSFAAHRYFATMTTSGSPGSKGIWLLRILVFLGPVGVTAFDFLHALRIAAGGTLPLDVNEYAQIHDFFDWYSSTRLAYESAFEAMPQTLLQVYVLLHQTFTRKEHGADLDIDTVTLLWSLALSAYQLTTNVLIGAVKANMNPFTYLASLGSGLPFLELQQNTISDLKLPFIPKGASFYRLLRRLAANKSVHTVNMRNGGTLKVGNDQAWTLDHADNLERKAIVLTMLQRDGKTPGQLIIKQATGERVVLPLIDLRTFEFAHKRLNGTLGAEAIHYLVRGSTTLSVIDLSSNPLFGDSGLKTLAKAIAKNSSLTKLLCNDCEIGDSGVKALAAALPFSSKLADIELRGNNRIRANGVSTLFAAAAKHPSMTTITVGRPALPIHLRSQEKIELHGLSDLDCLALLTVSSSLAATSNVTPENPRSLVVHGASVSAAGSGQLLSVVRALDSLLTIDIEDGVEVTAGGLHGLKSYLQATNLRGISVKLRGIELNSFAADIHAEPTRTMLLLLDKGTLDSFVVNGATSEQLKRRKREEEERELVQRRMEEERRKIQEDRERAEFLAKEERRKLEQDRARVKESAQEERRKLEMERRRLQEERARADRRVQEERRKLEEERERARSLSAL